MSTPGTALLLDLDDRAAATAVVATFTAAGIAVERAEGPHGSVRLWAWIAGTHDDPRRFLPGVRDARVAVASPGNCLVLVVEGGTEHVVVDCRPGDLGPEQVDAAADVFDVEPATGTDSWWDALGLPWPGPRG